MEWRCRECGRTYAEPPETCPCGAANLEPADGADDRSRFSLLAIRQRLVDSRNADRSLIRNEPYLALAFRMLAAMALLGAVALAVLLLV